MVHKVLRIIKLDPFLPGLYMFLAKSQVNCLIVLLVNVLKFDYVLFEVLEVAFPLRVCARSEAFIVFYVPFLCEISFGLVPVLVVLDREKRCLVFSFSDFYDGGDELFEEVVVTDQARPEVVDKINDKSLDMRSVMVLICHYYQTSIS